MAPRNNRPLPPDAHKHISMLIQAEEGKSLVDPAKVHFLESPSRHIDQLRLFARLRAKQLAARYSRAARLRVGMSQRELSASLGLKSGYIHE